MAARSLVIKVTAGKDDPERCNQAFTVAAAAVASGVEVSLWLSGESAWFALPGRAEDFSLPHAAPLADLLVTDADDSSEIEVVTDAGRFETFLDTQLRGWELPEAALERKDGRGEVALATGYRPGSRVRTGRRGWRNAPLEVRVQDNGPGVPADLRHRLFDAFVTTKDRGMGLGLTLVAKLVDSHEGLIELESEPGRTVFHILLPIAHDAMAPAES